MILHKAIVEAIAAIDSAVEAYRASTLDAEDIDTLSDYAIVLSDQVDAIERRAAITAYDSTIVFS